MFWEALILQAKTSTHSTYNIGDRASPCLTPLSNGIESDKKSLTRTHIYAALYRVAMQVETMDRSRIIQVSLEKRIYLHKQRLSPDPGKTGYQIRHYVR